MHLVGVSLLKLTVAVLPLLMSYLDVSHLKLTLELACYVGVSLLKLTLTTLL